MHERVIERIECFVGWNAEADRLVDRVVAEIDARAVVGLVPEERDLEAAADAPGELPAGLVGESCRAHDRCLLGLVFGCRRSRGGSAGEWVGNQPAIVKLSRTTLEIGFSLPVMSAGAVPLTA